MSSVLTRQQLDGAAQPLVSLNLCDVEQTARAAVERARTEAKRLLVEAVARAREMEHVAAGRGQKAGYDTGFKSGHEAGRVEALAAETKRIQEATATVRQALLATLEEIEGRRHQVLAEARQDLLRLAVAIAERICRVRVSQSDEHVRPLLDEVIEMSGKQSGLVLRVNPADGEAVEKFISEIHAALGGGPAVAASATAPICLVRDAGVSRGGCVAERAGGAVDARIETQIARIVAELTGVDAASASAAGGER